jgi:hypothetical protein
MRSLVKYAERIELACKLFKEEGNEVKFKQQLGGLKGKYSRLLK